MAAGARAPFLHVIVFARPTQPLRLRVFDTRALLAAHPEQQAMLAAELDAAGLLESPANPYPRAMAFPDLPRLPYLDAVRNSPGALHGLSQTNAARHSCCSEGWWQVANLGYPCLAACSFVQMTEHGACHEPLACQTPLAGKIDVRAKVCTLAPGHQGEPAHVPGRRHGAQPLHRRGHRPGRVPNPSWHRGPGQHVCWMCGTPLMHVCRLASSGTPGRPWEVSSQH